MFNVVPRCDYVLFFAADHSFSSRSLVFSFLYWRSLSSSLVFYRHKTKLQTFKLEFKFSLVCVKLPVLCATLAPLLVFVSPRSAVWWSAVSRVVKQTAGSHGACCPVLSFFYSPVEVPKINGLPGVVASVYVGVSFASAYYDVLKQERSKSVMASAGSLVPTRPSPFPMETRLLQRGIRCYNCYALVCCS